MRKKRLGKRAKTLDAMFRELLRNHPKHTRIVFQQILAQGQLNKENREGIRRKFRELYAAQVWLKA